MSKFKHISDYLFDNASANGDGLALVTDERSLSWSELAGEVEKAASGLSRHLSGEEQQVVGLLFANSWEFVVAYLAIIHSGHIASPLDPTYKELELEAIIDQIKPVLVLSNDEYRAKIKHPRIIELDELKARKKAGGYLRLDPAEQIASLTFTSGTTGKPKLAPYTHANHLWNIEVCSKAWDWTNKDSLLISLPLSHWYGLVMGLSGVLYHGNKMHLDRWFDPVATLKTLSSGKVSMFTHFPLAYAQMAEASNPKQYDLSKTRVFISGGAPLPPAIADKFKGLYGVDILETYGSSESGRIAANTKRDYQPGSAGKILPGVEIKLSDKNEVLIKSAGVFPGYFRNKEATTAALDAEGWWHTGDIGELKGRRLFLKGRMQEKIRRFGYSLSPRDIEWALLKFAKIKAVYVMGRQREGQPNDELVYFVDGNATAEEIRAFCKANLPYAWRPDRIILLDNIPKTRSGKTKLAALEDMLEEPALSGGRH